MGTWGEYYKRNHDFLHARLHNYIEAREVDDDGSIIGGILGVSRLPNYISDTVNDVFNDYVTAPLASTIEYIAQSPLKPNDGPSAVSDVHGPLKSGEDMFRRGRSGMGRGRGGRGGRGRGRRRGRRSRAPGVNRLQQYTGMPPPPPVTKGQMKRFRLNQMDGSRAWNSGFSNGQPRYNGSYNSGGSVNPYYNPRYNSRDIAYADYNRGRELPRIRGDTIRPEPAGFVASGGDIKVPSKMGNDYRIKKITKEGTFLTAKIYLGKLGENSTAGGPVTWTVPGNGSIDIGGQYYFNPANGTYVPAVNQVNKNAVSFEDYRVLGGKLVLTPLVSAYSNSDYRIAVLVCNSVDYATRMSSGNFVNASKTGTGTLNREVVLANPAACTSACWAQEIVCPIPPSGWRKCAGPDLTTAFDFTDVSANQRQAYAFCIFVNVNSTSVPASPLYTNELWLNVDIQFKNQVYSTNVNTPSPLPPVLSTATDDEVLRLAHVLRTMRVERKKKSSSVKSTKSEKKSLPPAGTVSADEASRQPMAYLSDYLKVEPGEESE